MCFSLQTLIKPALSSRVTIGDSSFLISSFCTTAGVAVYTGMESKMALNYKCKSQKRSAVEK